MVQNVNKKIITKAGDDMERPLPKQYPTRTSAELNTLLSAAKSYRNTRNEKLRSHRTNVVFPAFQKELLAAGLENDLITDVGVNQWKRLRYADRWLSYLLKPLPEIILSFTKSEFVHVKNQSVVPHKDRNDQGLTGSICFGRFAGGDFCLQELGYRLKMLSGDFMLMNARFLAHCLCHIDGERTCLVFLNKSSKDNLVKHVSQMEPGSELDAVRAEKHRRDKQKRDKYSQALSTELEVLKRYLGDDVTIEGVTVTLHDISMLSWEEIYKLEHVLNSPSKLLTSSLEKKKRVKGLKDAGLVDQAAAAEEQPSPFFYPFMRQEQNRWDKDPTSDPFVPLAAIKKEQKRKRVDQED